MNTKMKFFNSCLAFLSFLIILACSEDEPEAKNARSYGGTVTASVDGSIVSLSRNTIYVYSGILTFDAFQDQRNIFSYTIYSGVAETSYKIDRDDVPLIFFPDDNGSNYGVKDDARTGEIVITEIDEEAGTMSGTFSSVLHRFDAEDDSIMVSNGVFTDVPYVVQEEASGKQIIGKLDGKEFRGTLGQRSGGAYELSYVYVNGNQYLRLSLPAGIEVGDYEVAASDDSPIRIGYINGIHSYSATSGTLSVTSHNTTERYIEFTYNMVLEPYPVNGEPLSFTDGKLLVTY